MNKIKFFFLLISILFVSCKNFFTSDVSEKCEDKAILCISTDLLNSRTVLPIGINENMFDFSWKLVGFSVNTSFEKVWEDDITSGKTSYQSMISDNSILLDVGSWNFELTTYNKENLKVLTSSLICDLISGSNFLQFNMYEPIGAGIAPGYVDFKLNFPSNVIKKCVAKLYDLNTNVIVSDSEKVIIADNSSSLSSVVYDLNGNSIDSGYYYLIVDLQQEINNDTYAAVVFSVSAFSADFLYFQAYYQNLSWSYVEAAQIDGANDFQAYFKVMIPQTMPLLTALFIGGFIGGWSAYETQMVQQPEIPTLPVGIYLFEQEMVYRARLDILFAACFIRSHSLFLKSAYSKNFTAKCHFPRHSYVVFNRSS